MNHNNFTKIKNIEKYKSRLRGTKDYKIVKINETKGRRVFKDTITKREDILIMNYMFKN